MKKQRKIKINTTSLYLVCPEDDLNTITPLVRMFFQHLSGVLHRAAPGEDEPFKVLFLLDEFDKLGRMDTIVEAYKTIRAYGGRIVVITQSISQLYDIYGQEAVKGFVSNAGVRAFAATGDLDAAQMISEIIGDRTHAGVSRSTNPSTGFGVMTPKSRLVKDEAVRLMKVQDITGLPEDKFLIVRSPKRPVVVDRIRYYEDRYFQGVFEAQEGRPLPYPGRSAPKAVKVQAPAPPAASPAPAKPEQSGGASGEEQLEELVEESADLSAPPFLPPAMRSKAATAQTQAPHGAKARRNFKERASGQARAGDYETSSLDGMNKPQRSADDAQG